MRKPVPVMATSTSSALVSRDPWEKMGVISEMRPPRPSCPGPEPVDTIWAIRSSKCTWLYLKPVVLRLAMLSPNTPMASPLLLRPVNPVYIALEIDIA